MDAYQQYIHKSRYARYLPEQQRRETWEETIDRYLNFWIEKGKLTLEEANGICGDTITKVNQLKTYVRVSGILKD